MTRSFVPDTIETSAGPIAYVDSHPSSHPSSHQGSPAIVLLHGYPNTADSWSGVIDAAAGDARVIAIDLPGIGGSVDAPTDGTTSAIARVVHEVVAGHGLDAPIIVGTDLGAMVAFSYLRLFDDAAGGVLANSVIPGVDPWKQVLANPYVWHFTFNSIPDLPELLVAGHEAEWFDYFFDALSFAEIPAEVRAAETAGYTDPRALSAGFDWYRGLATAAKENAEVIDVAVPVLYLRGDHESGDLDVYAEGLRRTGIRSLSTGLIEGSGHFAPIEAPAATWSAISKFAATLPHA